MLPAKIQMDVNLPHTNSMELVEAKITAAKLGTPVAAREVHQILESVPGVVQVRLDGEHVFVVYDPVQITKKELSAKLAKSGHEVSEVKAGRDSPMA